MEGLKPKRWKTSATSMYNLGYHLIWCPKYRRKVLVGDIEIRLKELLLEKASELGLRIEKMEMMPDHVHLFIKAQPTDAPHFIVGHPLKNHKLAKSISDAGWYQFFQMLEYKSKWYGREFVKVAPKHTSQDCNFCGWRNTDLQLSDRSWTCPNGHTLDRDVNAAINIRNKGVGHTLSAWEIYNRSSEVAQESHLL